MKKGRLSKILALGGVILLSAVTIGVTSCDDSTTTSSVRIVITGGRNGYIGGTCQLTATVFNSDSDEVSWSSDNPTVATVDENGLVSFLTVGTANITATQGDASSSPVQLKVSEGDAVLELTSSPSRLSYYTGEQLSFSGLKVTGYQYDNGYRVNDSGVDLTNADLEFSIPEGTVLEAGTHTITVSLDGYESTSFTVTVGDTIVEKKLYVSSYPNTSTYVISDDSTTTFASRGLEVQSLTYVNGVLDESATETLSSSEYSLSTQNGQTLLTEGTRTITVYADGYISTSFNIMVYTEDTTIVDLIEDLQNSTNYQVEIFNNVGTTRDSYGFHYLRTYTETYYDEIEYQNTYNSTTSQIEFSTDQMKSHIGYATYDYLDGTINHHGIVGYTINTLGRLQYDVIIQEGSTISSWWDMASTLATLLTEFDLDDLPAYTLNGDFLTITVDQVAGDDDDGTLTLANYPLIEQFFSYVGWSSSLITITDRLTLSFNSSGNFVMRADFGYYGYTELVIQNINTASNAQVESFLLSGMDSDDWTDLHTASDDVKGAVDPLFDNNYTLVNYSNNSNVYAYFTENYAYDNTARDGYFIKDDTIYYFTGSSANNFEYSAVSDYDSSSETFYEYVTEQGTSFTDRYFSTGMEPIFGDGEDDDGQLYLFSKYDGYSYGDMITYQTYDASIIAYYYNDFMNSLTGSDRVSLGDTYRLWLCPYYEDVDNLIGIYSYEIWAIDFTSMSGFVSTLINVGNTSVSWLESCIADV